MEQSKAIVLKAHQLNEHSKVINLFTEKYGLKSYIIYTKKYKALISPLVQVEYVAVKKKGSLLQIKEISRNNVYNQIGLHPIKNAIAFFICEIISDILKEEEYNQELYNFISQAISVFDLDEQNGNFHLWFLIKLSSYIGLLPKSKGELSFFDINEGEFTTIKPKHDNYLKEELASKFYLLLNCIHTDYNEVVLSRKQRKTLTKSLISFYQLHLNNFPEPKSISVLETVLD